MTHETRLPISLHSYAEAAAVLKVEESWLRRHIRKLPHSKLGGHVRFTDEDLRRVVDLFHQEPSTVKLATPGDTGALGPLRSLRPIPRSTVGRAA
ncbi:helix-turn-helix domain-containing protein [Streptomyces sp. NBC_00102]|uniref:helix-turn-helix domain-containing protein n=1 Tax=Streptomyces sp. NBC_00102 TaxID=2975652 RepID=UPI002B1D2E23|nr:helix-turn-helix domain-containing protein [Streptomyces sp. NBC_00102]